jgi:hypothetical protein
MKFDHELDLLNEQLEELERDLNRLERKLHELLRLYVDAETAEQCLSMVEAIALASDLEQRPHDIRVRERRASFKVIKAAPSER